jgi:histidinol-phosphate aminotransferase
MNQTAIIAGVESVKDKDYFYNRNQDIIDIRNKAEESFRKLGFSFPESGANFLFVTHEYIPAKELYQALRDNKIYVRYFELPRIDNYLRITMGTREQMEKLFEFLDTYIKSK